MFEILTNSRNLCTINSVRFGSAQAGVAGPAERPLHPGEKAPTGAQAADAGSWRFWKLHLLANDWERVMHLHFSFENGKRKKEHHGGR